MKSGSYRWAWVVTVALAGVAVAEETAAPTVGPTTRQAGATTKPWKLAKRLAAPGVTKGEEPTEEEWKGVVEFMGENSPNRLKAIEELRVGERGGPLRKTVWGHYRDLQAAKERGDQELYDAKLAVVKADDELWGLQRQMREAAEADRPVLRRPLREKVAEVIKLGLKERGLRIARLEKALEEEKQQLASDEQNVGQRVDERMKSILRGSGGAARAERRGDGSGATTVEVVGSPVK